MSCASLQNSFSLTLTPQLSRVRQYLLGSRKMICSIYILPQGGAPGGGIKKYAAGLGFESFATDFNTYRSGKK